jgi:hypothetical protein
MNGGVMAAIVIAEKTTGGNVVIEFDAGKFI